MEIETIRLTEKEIHDIVITGCKNKPLDSNVVAKHDYGLFEVEIECFYFKQRTKHATIKSIKAYHKDSGDDIEIIHEIDHSDTRNSRVAI